MLYLESSHGQCFQIRFWVGLQHQTPWTHTPRSDPRISPLHHLYIHTASDSVDSTLQGNLLITKQHKNVTTLCDLLLQRQLLQTTETCTSCILHCG